MADSSQINNFGTNQNWKQLPLKNPYKTRLQKSELNVTKQQNNLSHSQRSSDPSKFIAIVYKLVL